jgi:uncharacterized protein (DUF433 family)
MAGATLMRYDTILYSPRPQGTKRARAIIEAYQSGMTLAEVGAQYGVNAGTIYKVLINHGIPRRHQGPRETKRVCSERNRDIIAMYQAGSSLEQTGAKYGLTRERVRQIAPQRHREPDTR